MDIEQAVQKIQNGNSEAYEYVVSQYQQALFKYTYYMMGNEEESKDITQEIFINVYKNIKSYKNNSNFNAWIYKIAYNICVTRIKKLKREKALINILTIFKNEDIQEDRENSQRTSLQEAMLKLNESERNLIILRIVEEKTYDEISHILNIKCSTLRKRFERTKTKLIQIIKESESIEKQSFCR